MNYWPKAIDNTGKFFQSKMAGSIADKAE
jgi:hypothetical protein